MEILIVKLKSLYSSTCSNLNYDSKTETKNVKGAEMVGFIKTCDQYPHKFNVGHFFCSLIFSPPPFLLGEI